MEREEDNRIRMEVNKMPHGDRTGPMGRGSRTGRVDGSCNRYDMPGHRNRGVIYRVGGRRNTSTGGGKRNRHWYYATGLPGWARFDYAPPGWYGPYAAPPIPEQEAESLKAQAEWLKEQLDAINQRIAGLEKEA